jgi:hypothetical protein
MVPDAEEVATATAVGGTGANVTIVMAELLVLKLAAQPTVQVVRHTHRHTARERAHAAEHVTGGDTRGWCTTVTERPHVGHDAAVAASAASGCEAHTQRNGA